MDRSELLKLATARKRQKYNAQPTVVDGIRFASKAEATRWQQLGLLERAGEITGICRQVRFPLEVCGVKVTTYVADFVYQDAKRGRVIEDVKGVSTPLFKLKRKMFEAIYQQEITIIGRGE